MRAAEGRSPTWRPDPALVQELALTADAIDFAGTAGALACWTLAVFQARHSTPSGTPVWPVLLLLLVSHTQAFDPWLWTLQSPRDLWTSEEIHPLVLPVGEGDALPLMTGRDGVAGVLIRGGGALVHYRDWIQRVEPGERLATPSALTPSARVELAVDERATIEDLYHAADSFAEFPSLVLGWRILRLHEASAATERWPLLARASNAMRGREVYLVPHDAACHDHQGGARVCALRRQDYPRQVHLIDAPPEQLLRDWLASADLTGHAYGIMVEPPDGQAGIAFPPERRRVWEPSTREESATRATWIGPDPGDSQLGPYSSPLAYVLGWLLGLFFVLAAAFAEWRAIQEQTAGLQTCALAGPETRLLPSWVRKTAADIRLRETTAGGPFREGAGGHLLVASRETAMREFLRELLRAHLALFAAGASWLGLAALVSAAGTSVFLIW